MRKKDIADTPRVPPEYTITMIRKRWALTFYKNTITGARRRKILLYCKAASENGAHREALIWLKKNP